MNDTQQLVTDRGETYGPPSLNLGERTARLWTAYLKDLGIVRDIDGRDVANLMILLKMARLQHRPDHEDSWRDMSGYAETGRIMHPEAAV
jgi:hypothetical protein